MFLIYLGEAENLLQPKADDAGTALFPFERVDISIQRSGTRFHNHQRFYFCWKGYLRSQRRVVTGPPRVQPPLAFLRLVKHNFRNDGDQSKVIFENLRIL